LVYEYFSLFVSKKDLLALDKNPLWRHRFIVIGVAQKKDLMPYEWLPLASPLSHTTLIIPDK
jgi:hypothetical protein